MGSTARHHMTTVHHLGHDGRLVLKRLTLFVNSEQRRVDRVKAIAAQATRAPVALQADTKPHVQLSGLFLTLQGMCGGRTAGAALVQGGDRMQGVLFRRVGGLPRGGLHHRGKAAHHVRDRVQLAVLRRATTAQSLVFSA